MNTIDAVKPNGLVPMVLYLCKECGRRFSCEAPQHETDSRACPYCHGAKPASGTPKRRKAGSGVSKAGSGISRPGSGLSRGVRGRWAPDRGRKVSRWALGISGALAAASTLILVLHVGGGNARVEAAKNDASHPDATGGASALQTDEPTHEVALGAERKARVAFDKLEANLKRLPAGDSARRTALREGFLREHGTTIQASRVRVQMGSKDR